MLKGRGVGVILRRFCRRIYELDWEILRSAQDDRALVVFPAKKPVNLGKKYEDKKSESRR